MVILPWQIFSVLYLAMCNRDENIYMLDQTLRPEGSIRLCFYNSLHASLWFKTDVQCPGFIWALGMHRKWLKGIFITSPILCNPGGSAEIYSIKLQKKKKENLDQ